MDKTFPERVQGSFKNRVFTLIPNGPVKDWLWWQYMRSRLSGLQRSISRLEIEEQGQDGEFVFVRVRGRLTFYGLKSTEGIRRLWNFSDKSKEFELFGTLADIVERYEYPQAIPIAPPYPASYRRSCYHHSGSIADLGVSPEQQLLLTERFTPKPGDIVLDIGAYIGYGTMKLSEMVGSKGKVVAFECNPDTLSLLVKNIVENKLSNVTLIGKAAWNKNEEAMLGESEPQGRSLIEGNKTLKVAGVTIDSVVEQLGLSRVSLISLTINGAEIEALQGARDTLEKYHPNISAIGWVYRNGRPVWKTTKPFLESMGYTCLVGGHGRVLAWRD